MVEKYQIETKEDISFVKEKIKNLFSEKNHVLKGKFVGSLNDNTFKGSTNYNVHITIKGYIYKNDEKTIIDLSISDNSPNKTTIITTLIIVFLLLSLVIIAANKTTDYIIYLIPIIIFGFAYSGLRLKLFLSKHFRIRFKKPEEKIAKEVNGVLVKRS